MIEAIIYGVLGGLGWAITGYVNELAKGTGKEAFSITKFLRSVIIGGLAGGYAAYAGGTIDIVMASGISYTITAVADRIVSIVWKIISPTKTAKK